MSQMFMENNFPLPHRTDIDELRDEINNSLYRENADPTVDEVGPDAVLYTRSDWTYIRNRLHDMRIELTPEEEAELIDFTSDYASMVDEEDDANVDRANMEEAK